MRRGHTVLRIQRAVRGVLQPDSHTTGGGLPPRPSAGTRNALDAATAHAYLDQWKVQHGAALSGKERERSCGRGVCIDLGERQPLRLGVKLRLDRPPRSRAPRTAHGRVARSLASTQTRRARLQPPVGRDPQPAAGWAHRPCRPNCPASPPGPRRARAAARAVWAGCTTGRRVDPSPRPARSPCARAVRPPTLAVRHMPFPSHNVRPCRRP